MTEYEYDACDANEILIYIRSESGMTQRDFAKIADVVPSSISRWEQMGRDISMSRLASIAKMFGYKVTILLKEDE